MRAAILAEIGSPLQVVDITIDTPAANEVLVCAAAAGICHSDLQFIAGRKHMPTPYVAGHESSGIVAAVGSQVQYVQPGDRVVTYLNAFCGQCRYCLTGRPFLCREPSTRRPAEAEPRLRHGGQPIEQFFNVSAFAEQLLVHESQVAKIPAELPLDRAALLGCAALTGLGAVFHTAQVRPGDTVAVFGCGGVGLNIVQGARLAGAGQVIAIDPVPAKRALAIKLGATAAFEPGPDTVGTLIEITRGGLDHAFDAIGMKSVSEQCMAAIARGGATIVVGMMADAERLEITPLDMVIGKRVLGCSMGSNRARLDIPAYAELYLAGRLNLDDLISERVGLERIGDAVTALSANATTRNLVIFDQAES